MTDAALTKWLREELPRIQKGTLRLGSPLVPTGLLEGTVDALTALVALLREGEEASDVVLDDYYCQTSREEVARWVTWKARLRAVLGEGR